MKVVGVLDVWSRRVEGVVVGPCGVFNDIFIVFIELSNNSQCRLKKNQELKSSRFWNNKVMTLTRLRSSDMKSESPQRLISSYRKHAMEVLLVKETERVPKEKSSQLHCDD